MAEILMRYFRNSLWLLIGIKAAELKFKAAIMLMIASKNSVIVLRPVIFKSVV
jgi:hypothetical protein